MPTPPLSDEAAQEAADAFAIHGNKTLAAGILGLNRSTFNDRLRHAAARGMCGTEPVMPGFKIAKVSNTPSGDYIQQKPDLGAPYEPIESLAVKGRTTWAEINPDGSRTATREVIMERASAEAHANAMRAAVEAFTDEIPRAEPISAPVATLDHLLSQYTLTDVHLGALAWNEETGGGDYDLSIGERLVLDWFAAAIAASPNSKRAVFAQLGDFLHYDSFKSITPEHGHLLDGDTRYPKMVRTAIRVIRRVITMLLEKHERVDIVMADANHDPSSEVWLRELFAAWLEDEPRVHVDVSPGSYTYLEHGKVSLFYHHGHRRKVANVDSVFAGRFREVYGRTKFSFVHTGHLHSDELKTTNLMKVERHETVAAPDAFAANGGWLSGRSAKVIHYHDLYGEVGRNTLTPEMVAGAYMAANDNAKMEAVA